MGIEKSNESENGGLCKKRGLMNGKQQENKDQVRFSQTHMHFDVAETQIACFGTCLSLNSANFCFS